MNWIKMRTELRLDPRVVQIALATELDEYGAVGRLHAIWSWLDQHSADGLDVPISFAFIDRVVACPGFAAAMCAVGWLSGGDGAVTFPRYLEHNGETAKRRAGEGKRKQRQRSDAPQRDKCPANDGTDPGTFCGPEERRGEKKRGGGGGTSSSTETVCLENQKPSSPSAPENGDVQSPPLPPKPVAPPPPPPPDLGNDSAKPSAPEISTDIPTAAEVIAFGVKAGIPPSYCEGFHTRTTEKRMWFNSYGRVVDWTRQIVRFWASDRATWREDKASPSSATKPEKWREEWLPWLETHGHNIDRNRDYQFADTLLKDAFWKERRGRKREGVSPPQLCVN